MSLSDEVLMPPASDNGDDLPSRYEELAVEAHELRERINRFRIALGRHLVGRQQVVDLMVTAAVAQEPLLLVGPPGTAKSDLVLKFKDALGVSDEDYFEYLLTRFSEPSEILGPIDINQLREGRFIRRQEGKLPSAQLVFLDEIFQSNSAILNSLLSIINERKVYQDGRAQAVRMRFLFAAANEIPEHGELAALKDRFCLKVPCRCVQRTHFEELIDTGLALEARRQLNQKPWAEGHATLMDFRWAHRYLSLQMARESHGGDGHGSGDRERFFGGEELAEMRRMIRTMASEDGIQISDRKVIKLYRLLRTHAWIARGGVVERDDLLLLSFIGDSDRELDILGKKIPRLLAVWE